MSTTIAADGKVPSNAFESRNVFATSNVTKMTDDIVVVDKSISAAGKPRRFVSIASPTAGRKCYRRKKAVIASNHPVESVIFFENENDDE
jgi:hypothetical protein